MEKDLKFRVFSCFSYSCISELIFILRTRGKVEVDMENKKKNQIAGIYLDPKTCTLLLEILI